MKSELYTNYIIETTLEAINIIYNYPIPSNERMEAIGKVLKRWQDAISNGTENKTNEQ